MRILDYARNNLSGRLHFVASEGGVRFQSRPSRTHTRRAWLPVAAVAGAAALVITVSAHQTPLSAGEELALLRHAAEQGNTGAQIQLGLAYREGRFGLLPDEAEGHVWLHRAAQAGDRYAAQLESGGNAAIDTDTMSQWFHGFLQILSQGNLAEHSAGRLIAAAQAGDPLAQYQLAMRYRDGSWGVDADPVQARFWLQRAAESGNRVAMRTLASAYAQGLLGLPRDDGQANAWRARAGRTETPRGQHL